MSGTGGNWLEGVPGSAVEPAESSSNSWRQWAKELEAENRSLRALVAACRPSVAAVAVVNGDVVTTQILGRIDEALAETDPDWLAGVISGRLLVHDPARRSRHECVRCEQADDLINPKTGVCDYCERHDAAREEMDRQQRKAAYYIFRGSEQVGFGFTLAEAVASAEGAR